VNEDGHIAEAPPILPASTRTEKRYQQFTIGRRLFILIVLLDTAAATAFQRNGELDYRIVIGGLLFTAAACMRLRSIGYSGWYALLTAVPLVNVFLGYRLCAYPPGYADSKRPDTAMRVISVVYLSFCAVILISAIIPVWEAVKSNSSGSLAESPTAVTPKTDDPYSTLRKRAESGNAEAQFKLGAMYLFGYEGAQKNSKEGAKWLRKAAEQGVAGAQYDLGTIYLSGDGVPLDKTEAARWFKKAGDQGETEALYILAKLYANGVGVEQDSAEAAKYYRIAASLGNARAQFALGVLYSNGVGVPRDDEEAAKWYKLAAAKGNVTAAYNLGVQYFNGEGTAKDSVEATKWFRVAAELGDQKSQYQLGYMYSNGEGVPKNGTEALKWYLMAAAQGDLGAQTNLGHLFSSGDGVPADPLEAIKWYKMAAAQGGSIAQSALGDCYEYGHGVDKDSVEAFRWYRMAAVNGDSDAQNDVGVMYSQGDGVPKDEVEGLAWLNIVAASGDKDAVKNQQGAERYLGRNYTLLAQQRTKELLKEIDAAKNSSASSSDEDSSPAVSTAEGAPVASGSGAIVSTDGYVLTAAHVVSGANKIKIYTTVGLLSASVIRVDKLNDIAILKLADGTYPALPIASSQKVRLGQSVSTIGFPETDLQGFSPKVTRGEISSVNGFRDDPREWQISVPVQPGNSGGALLDEDGNLVGIVVSKLGLKATELTGDIPQNVNYAVKSSYALDILKPYLNGNAPEARRAVSPQRFEDMVADAQPSVVLILVY
jgi:TPR repeat protein/uncharacterized membrane protein YhaH (DUF805 family)